MEVMYQRSDGSMVSLMPQNILKPISYDIMNFHVPAQGENFTSGSFSNEPGIQFASLFNAKNTPEAYGNIVNIAGRNSASIMASQLMLSVSGTGGLDDYTTLPTYSIYYRSHTDGGHFGWSPWRKLAFYDEITGVVNSILKSNGLIK